MNYLLPAILLLLSFALYACAQGPAANPKQAKEMIQGGARVIDVRTEGEYAGGHLPQAAHIPYQEIAERISEVTTNKELPIVLYCRSGRRSGIATKTLQDLGFTNVLNGGGYGDLR